MSVACRRFAATLFACTALLTSAQAFAAPCAGGTAGTLTVGSAQRVEPGPARSFALELAAGQGVLIDLSSLAAPKPKSEDGDGEDEGDSAKGPPSDLGLCAADGALLAPQPGEVFEKGGSVSTTDDGTRLRFVAPKEGRYTVWLAASGDARELLVRGRDLGKAGGVIATRIGASVEGHVSSARPQTYTFAGTAGQWVELKATSESDTVLHLAGPARDGSYSVIATNDDSDGLNPMIRRRLPQTGTYYLQVDSLADKADSFTLTTKSVVAPPAPPPPAALRSGAAVTGKLADEDDKRVYTLAVTEGHSYRIDVNARYDAAVAVGINNPIEGDDGKDGPDAAFSEVKSEDSGTSGTEHLSFTARSTGQLMVLVKCFGIGETDGSYTLTATDLGG